MSLQTKIEESLKEFDEKIFELELGVKECKPMEWYVNEKYPELKSFLKQSQLELLDEVVKEIKNYAWCDLENGRGRYLLENDIIRILKSKE